MNVSSNDQIGSKSALEKFIEEWKRHPISLSIIIIVVNIAFVYMVTVGKGEEVIKWAVVSTYCFSIIIFTIVFFILYKKKGVLYNSIDLISNEIEKRKSFLKEKLNKVELGIGEPYKDIIDDYCACLPSHPINLELRRSVNIYEFLKKIQKDCGIDNEEDFYTEIALAKYYYKNKDYNLALEKINSAIASPGFKDDIKNKDCSSKIQKGEAEFIKGLILRELGRIDESNNSFEESCNKKYFLAKCFSGKCKPNKAQICLDQLEEFIVFSTKECKFKNSNSNCINRVALAYYNRGVFFSKNDEDLKEDLSNALLYAELAIERFESWTAYFNKACYLSVLAQKGDFRVKNRYSSEKEIKNEIIKCLRVSFEIKPELVVYCKHEVDLKWVKEKYKKEFFETIGLGYEKIQFSM